MHDYVVGDVCGHHVGTAMTTAAIQALLHQNGTALYSPPEILKTINRVARTLVHGGRYVTLVYARLNRRTHRLQVASAVTRRRSCSGPMGRPRLYGWKGMSSAHSKGPISAASKPRSTPGSAFSCSATHWWKVGRRGAPPRTGRPGSTACFERSRRSGSGRRKPLHFLWKRSSRAAPPRTI